MKREAIDHTKIKRLCRRLRIPRYQAVGILETLWHLTAKEAARGDIGKLSNEDIALSLDYQEDEDELIECLTACGWLDIHPEHRLVVHDWIEHVDDAVHMRLARARLFFWDGTAPKTGRLPTWERTQADEFYGSVRTESKSVRTESQSVSTACGDQSPAPPEPRQSPAPPCQSSSVFKKSKPDKNGNSEKLTTTDEKPKLVYASAKDELAALMLDSMGHRPERGFFVQLCEIIELRGGSVPAYTADMRARIRRLKDPPAEGFFTSQAKKIGVPDVAPIPEPKVEQPKNGHGRCLLCSGVGQTDKGFCSCAMGVDLAVIAARPQKEAS